MPIKLKPRTAFTNNTPVERISEYCRNLKPISTQSSYQDKWIQLAELLDMVSIQNHAAILLWDICNNRHIYMSDKTKVLGDYTGSLFTTQANLNFSFPKIHPEHINAATLIDEKGICYFMDHPHAISDKAVINMSCLCKKKEGGYFQFLLQAEVVETDELGNPLLFLCYGYDVTHIKKEHSCDLIINAAGSIQVWNYNFDKKKLEEVTPLSVQENKILLLLSKGKDSKEIANKLYVSSHTIDTHRRNLLKKTNCLNTTALITYAKMIGLLMVTFTLFNLSC